MLDNNDAQSILISKYFMLKLLPSMFNTFFLKKLDCPNFIRKGSDHTRNLPSLKWPCFEWDVFNSKHFAFLKRWIIISRIESHLTMVSPHPLLQGCSLWRKTDHGRFWINLWYNLCWWTIRSFCLFTRDGILLWPQIWM